jgi:hypothetical protein
MMKMEWEMTNKTIDPLSTKFLKPLRIAREKAGNRTWEVLITSIVFLVVGIWNGVRDIFEFEQIWSGGTEVYTTLLMLCGFIGAVSTVMQVLFLVEATEGHDNIVLIERFLTSPYGMSGSYYLATLFGLSLLSTVSAVAISVNLYAPLWVLSDYVWQYVATLGYIVFSFSATYQLHNIWVVDNTIADAMQERNAYQSMLKNGV